MVKPKVVIVTQARIGSTRFPGKVLERIGNDSMLGLHLKRLKRSTIADSIVVATTNEKGVESIIDIANEEGVLTYKGSTNDVLDRFYQAVKDIKPDFVVRVTSDCPLIDARLIDLVINMTIENNLDYGSNILKEEYPDGQDIEVILWDVLALAWQVAKLPSEREHVTPYIRSNTDSNGGQLFKAMNYASPYNFNGIRMTVDERADIEAIRNLVNQLGPVNDWRRYADYIINHPSEFSNQAIIRNAEYYKSIQKDLNT
ncbi:MAG: hypothetical protein WKF91_12665 [Segetibacter sp.]